MKRRGVHHVGLVTLDIDRTIEFYTQKLGFELAWCDVLEPSEGGRIQHAFLDSGDGTFVAFMSPKNVSGLPEELATDINSAQHLPPFFYHFAFWVDDVTELEAKRRDLEAKGVDVTPIVDHEWCRSIYLKDPNGLLLEYCATTRAFTEEDKAMRPKGAPPPAESAEDRRKIFEMLMTPKSRPEPPERTKSGKPPV